MDWSYWKVKNILLVPPIVHVNLYIYLYLSHILHPERITSTYTRIPRHRIYSSPPIPLFVFLSLFASLASLAPTQPAHRTSKS
ncbi:hypothetical protein J3E69DRAFT_250913 [Trichoderma sp. SZMC 28015]